MELPKNNKQVVTRYLLGAAAAEEQMAMEEKYLCDQGFFEQVVAVEKELLDNYARGLLSPRERELFERHYMAHPKRRARAMTACALVSTLDRLQPLEVTLVPESVRQSSWAETGLQVDENYDMPSNNRPVAVESFDSCRSETRSNRK